jgi:hypothetical protein
VFDADLALSGAGGRYAATAVPTARGASRALRRTVALLRAASVPSTAWAICARSIPMSCSMRSGNCDNSRIALRRSKLSLNEFHIPFNSVQIPVRPRRAVISRSDTTYNTYSELMPLSSADNKLIKQYVDQAITLTIRVNSATAPMNAMPTFV